MNRLGTARFGIGRAEDGWNAHLETPSSVRVARALGEVRPIVEWVEHEARQGQWAVLLLAYESAPAFDASLSVRAHDDRFPLAWAATYGAAAAVAVRADRRAAPLPSLRWRPSLDERRFTAALARILAHIAAGDTYQVNYTFPLTAEFTDEPWAWFAASAAQARVPYAACIDLGDQVVMSLSPELFVERQGGQLLTRPMKGTVRRGRWPEEDTRLARALTASAKARAENVMIVDLLRNDLGRIAETGSVRPRDLCRLERYPTVWQLTSTIEATARPGTTLLQTLDATFPCGSVTGAPKVRTMAIIAELERAPRGLYTGAICLLRPGGDMVSSVPIRTAVLDRRSRVATFNVGAGITADSLPSDEWAECLAKSRVVCRPAVPEDAALFETLRLEHGVLARRDAHLRRLLASAALFAWPAEETAIDAALDALAAAHRTGVWRARLLLQRDGALSAEAVPFDPSPRPWKVGRARTAVDVRSPLLFNKTTRRDLYDAARASVPGADDVILCNARDELTEGTLANLVVELDGVRVTPPVRCGLLPGVFRQELLTRGDVAERVVRAVDLRRASRVWLVNSLRGWIDTVLIDS